MRNFHGYTTPHGSTYNAYLITGEKNILIDTVRKPFLEEMLSRIRSVIDPKKIDLIVSNHVEMDHSANLLAMQQLTGAKVLASKLGVEGLRMHYPELRTELVEDGKVITCGGKTLKFIDTPMLHWPDSMFTYVEEDKVLFSMDGFGQHYANSKRFDDEVDQDVLFQEAAKYYANIILPFNARVLKTVEKIKDLDIKVLATSHGAIWRTNLDRILKSYIDWASSRTREKAVVVYDTMWGSTKIMAEAIADGIASEGVEVQIWKLTDTDRSWVMKEVLDSRAVIMGSPTPQQYHLPDRGRHDILPQGPPSHSPHRGCVRLVRLERRNGQGRARHYAFGRAGNAVRTATGPLYSQRRRSAEVLGAWTGHWAEDKRDVFSLNHLVRTTPAV